MLEVGLSNIEKTFGYNKHVLIGFNFEAKTGERIALIGPNGSGKTTVFNIIMGEESIQAGVITIRKGATIKALSQIPEAVDDKTTVRDILIKNLEEIFAMEEKMRELEKEMVKATGEKLTKIMKSYSKLQQTFETKGGYETESRINKICNGFKINNNMLNRSFNSLSGGEKTIVGLASLMIQKPSILLLDEPTNHLDIDTLEWFENYLKNYQGTIIISSHDRYFLDQVANKTVLIERGKSEVFHGNYSYYLIENERRIMKEFDDYKNQQKLIVAMKRKIKQLQEWGKLAYPGGELFFKRAASIQKRLDKLELLDKPEDKKDLPLNFLVDDRSGKDVIIVKDIDLTIGDKLLLKDTSFQLKYGEKTCLMGPNGSGKSSFIKALLGTIPLTKGEIKIGSNVVIGYIPQEIKFEDNNEQVITYVRKCFSGDETRLRSSLHKFMFYDDDVFKRVGSLSGGEKVRLKLFELIQKKANLLIMDEPTNHIDIATKEVLEDALNDFTGTLLFISHDRYFINKLTQKIIYIKNNTIIEYLGDYNYFKEKQD